MNVTMNHHHHHASPNDDTRVVDQTILWAREALQRRRRELQEQKNKLLISSYNEAGSHDVNVVERLTESQSLSSPGCALPSTEVHSMLERGRALLAEADAHSEILRKYASFHKNKIGILHKVDGMEGPTLSKQMHWTFGERNDSTTQQGTIHSRHVYKSHPAPNDPNSETPVESPDLDTCRDNGESKPVTPPPNEFDGDVEDQGDVLREGKARERLDELIRNIVDQEESETVTPEKRISNFDPSTMNSAKRAIIKKIKLDEAVATAEEQARLLTSFKALPLPGGVEVSNNLYATTQSFEGKHIGRSVEKLIRRRDTNRCDKLLLHDDASSIISGKMDTRDDFSSVRSMNSYDNSFIQSEYENDADRERARELLAEKKMKKRQLLKSVNKIVSEDMQFAPDDNESSEFSECFDFVEDPSKLRQDVARLEAKLKQTKTQRDATLNDIVDIDLNAIFDRFLPGESSDDARQIIDRLKERAFGCVSDFHNITPSANTSAPCKTQVDVSQRISVVQRQEEWSKRREQKLFKARMQLEADAMDGVTGKPEISQTAQSWKRAKESHDETMKIVAEVEEKKSREKAAKEKALNELKAEEERQAREKSMTKPKLVKCEVNKEEQMKRLEMLSRPRQTIEATILPCNETSVQLLADLFPEATILDSVQPKKKASKKVKSKREKKVESFNSDKYASKASTEPVSVSDKKPDEICGMPSFSDMSDKEFAKLVKRISKNASAYVRE